MDARIELWLVRHGETEWSLSGAHTGRTDIPLTDHGRKRAQELRGFLAGYAFTAVLSSPMQRALDTCRIAGYGDVVKIDENLREWDYGIYEGRTTKEIRQEHPSWSVWKDDIQQGESVRQVGERADKLIQDAEAAAADSCSDLNQIPRVALFAHAHILRIIAARWLGLLAKDGELFALGTGSVSVLGWERESRVLEKWN